MKALRWGSKFYLMTFMSLIGLFTAVMVQAAVSTGPMNVPRTYAQASLLRDGRVLVTGGRQPGGIFLNSTEIFDPATNVFTPATPLLQGRAEHAAVTMQDGRVLVVGGSTALNPGLVGTNSAEIYDPSTGNWTPTGSMSNAYPRVLARLLPDGRVFVMSSYGNLFTAEVYNPQTGVFTKTGYPVTTYSTGHGVVVLADGRVLKLGGTGTQGYVITAEIWDPATNQWTATGSMLNGREFIKPVLLPNGRVLVAGGTGVNNISLSSAEFFDPGTGTFSAAPAMLEAMGQVEHGLKLIDGDVLLSSSYNQRLMRYNAISNTWTYAGPKHQPVMGGGTATVFDFVGSVLLAGGYENNQPSTYSEIIDQGCLLQPLTLNTNSISLQGNFLKGITVSGTSGCRFEMTGLPNWVASTAQFPSMAIAPYGGYEISFMEGAPNNTGVPRTATFTLANQTVTVTQPSANVCVNKPQLSPSSFTFNAEPRGGTMTVTADSGCAWNLSGMPSWLTLTSANSGAGNASINYSVAANTGAQRSATLQLTGQVGSTSYSVTQSAPVPCPAMPYLTPSSISIPASGGSASMSVISYATNCSWSVKLPSWATLTSGGSGTGNGSFTFSVPANPNSTVRSGNGTVQGTVVGTSVDFAITQAAGSNQSCTAPAPQQISNYSTVSGNLTANACSYGLRGNGFNTDRYSFSAAPGNKVTISLSSTAFDTYVYLLDSTGKQITYNDDGGGGTNSRIPASSGSFTLPAGVAGQYVIQVTSYSTGKTGAYSLNLSVAP